jgi:hypothetical protein
MPKDLSHEEIARKFVEAKVVDFSAMGRLITELGPELAINDHGWHGVNFGRFNSLVCFLPAADVTRLVGSLRAAASVAPVLEGIVDASLPK